MAPDEIHDMACQTNGDEEIIVKNHQFIHVEADGFWRENIEFMTDVYKDFFPETEDDHFDIEDVHSRSMIPLAVYSVSLLLFI